MATFTERGYGQIEPNRLTGITFGNIEAQAPAYNLAAGEAIEELENGMVLCVVQDTLDVSPLYRIAVTPGEAPATTVPYLVYSEKKMYDERMGYSDFIDKAVDKVDGKLFPKLIGLTPDSCIFTTNTVDAAPGSISEGEILYVGDNGYISPTAGTNQVYSFVVLAVTTMPDGQEAVKLMVQNYR